MLVDDNQVFLLSPFVLLDLWIQVVVPSMNCEFCVGVLPLSALLSDSAGKSLGDLAPVAGPELMHFALQGFVLFVRPRAFGHGWVQHLLPAVEALDVRAVLELGGDPLPVFGLRVSRTGLPHVSSQVIRVVYPACVVLSVGSYLSFGPVALLDALAVRLLQVQRVRGQHVDIELVHLVLLLLCCHLDS